MGSALTKSLWMTSKMRGIFNVFIDGKDSRAVATTPLSFLVIRKLTHGLGL
jgi:hypothetical protein